jgi:hypothetical protein
MEKETSCINSRAIIDYMKTHYQGDPSSLLINLDPAIDALPDPESFLSDPNNWISCAVVSRLFDRAKLMLDDEMVAYKIARYAIEKTSLGYAQRIIFKAFWSVKKVLKNLQIVNDKWNRSKKIDLVKIKGSTAVLRLYWNPEMDVTKDICLYNQGAYAYLPMIWGGKPSVVE